MNIVIHDNAVCYGCRKKLNDVGLEHLNYCPGRMKNANNLFCRLFKHKLIDDYKCRRCLYVANHKEEK